MNIGDTIKLNDTDLLVLDFIDSKPFVLAYDLNIITGFSETSNDYKDSMLRKKCEDWFAGTNFRSLPRTIDLTTMDGYKGYGKLSTVAAPLTFDEYRKYSDIIIPRIQHPFWTATGWERPDNCKMSFACYVYVDGTIDYITYNDESLQLAPAFILEETPSHISFFSTVEFLEELKNCFMEVNT
jgi:hypothetical protein